VSVTVLVSSLLFNCSPILRLTDKYPCFWYRIGGSGHACGLPVAVPRTRSPKATSSAEHTASGGDEFAELWLKPSHLCLAVSFLQEVSSAEHAASGGGDVAHLLLKAWHLCLVVSFLQAASPMTTSIVRGTWTVMTSEKAFSTL
jgi:hypothetical protein